jgi:hypothetical protein
MSNQEIRKDYQERKDYIVQILKDTDATLNKSQLERIADAVAKEVLPGDREGHDHPMTDREIKDYWESRG